MNALFKYIIILLFMFPLRVGAQISPGDLSQSHAHLEGMSNCTKCHDLGKKVSINKCLDCHQEIKNLITAKRGYHGNSSHINKECIECHSEHNGRKFEMTRFDKENFDHDLTGYKLEGKHKVVDCGECHLPDNIADPEIKKRKNTFLGLNKECLSCHEDFHQKTLSKECLSCHNMEAFRPASKFDHNNSRFKLLGSHTRVDCKECHKISNRNGKSFQEFSGISFNDCNSCHNDPHNQRIKGKCSQCHNEVLFSNFIGKGRFNHNSTNFSLKGRHVDIDCYSCHSKTKNPKLVFKDRQGINENNCLKCHEDRHDGKFGKDCSQCHNEKSFISVKNMDSFDHSLTDYPLSGKHTEVDCKKCHPGRFSKAISFDACTDCHSDYHNGEFRKNGQIMDCIECHSLEHGFEYSLYSLDQHQQTTFPLEGAHMATPCFSCHKKEEKWKFREIGTECIDCHEDLHKGHISEKYYPDNTCGECHVADSWSSISGFDHNLTNWPLEGMHAATTCRECHFQPVNGSGFKQAFNTLDSNCSLCHENIHKDEFAINGETDCARCHIPDSWFPEKFDHNQTAFPLTGRHAEIECKKCHEIVQENGEKLIIYKIEKFECADCHL